MNLPYIKVENFKSFKKEVKFDIKPLTILTGPNSAGKSTLQQLLNLYKSNIHDSYKEISFMGNMNALDYADVLNKATESETISIVIPVGIPLSYTPYEMRLQYKKADDGLSMIMYKMDLVDLDSQEVCLSFIEDQSKSKQKVIRFIPETNLSYWLSKFDYAKDEFYKDIKLLKSYSALRNEPDRIFTIDEFYSDTQNTNHPIHKAIHSKLEQGRGFFGHYAQYSNRIISHKYYFRNNTSQAWPGFLNFNQSIKTTAHVVGNQSLERHESPSWSEYDSVLDPFFEKSSNLFTYKKKTSQIIDLLNSDDFKKIETQDGQDHFIQYLNLIFLGNDRGINFLSTTDPLEQDIIALDIHEGKIRSLFNDLKIHDAGPNMPTLTPFSAMVLRKEFKIDEHSSLFDTIYHCVHHGLINSIKQFSDFANNHVLIVSPEFSRKFIFPKGSSEPVLLACQKLQKCNTETKEFMLKYLKCLLNISDYKLEMTEDRTGTKININKNGVSSNLAREGTGVIQVFTLLMRLAVLLDKSYNQDSMNIIFIEEPECNTHPSLQTKIMDMLVDFIEKSGYMNQLVIETHSEYLIRRLQLMVATNKFDSNLIAINYLNSQNQEEKSFEIKIKTDGTLSRPFGPGFYDEADSLALKIFEINKSHNN